MQRVKHDLYKNYGLHMATIGMRINYACIRENNAFSASPD